MNSFVETLQEKAKATLDGYKKELLGIRANRPSSMLVEDIKVNYYGQMTLIKQLGTIGIQPPRDIVIQAWDKGAVPSIAKAIETSTLNLSANIEGNNIRIHLPELSEERRNELIKHIKKITEDHKIQIRHVRDEVNKEIQTAFEAKEIDEDQKFKSKEDVQGEIEKINKEIEKLLEDKIKEIKE